MKSRFIFTAAGAVASLLTALSINSCVKINNELGSSLIPLSNKYDLYTLEIPLENLMIKQVDGLSGYSNTRITIGSLRDSEFGLTTRTCALSLVPVLDSVEIGKNPVFKSFHFSAVHDTTSYADASEANILQNINVYELENSMDFSIEDLKTKIAHKNKRITSGIPVCNGKDSLSFDFTKEYGEKYLTMTIDDTKDMETYLKKFPGIYIETDDPVDMGGRINMFGLQLGVNQSEGYVDKNYAVLNFSAEYDGEVKDTAMLFYFSPTAIFDLDSLLSIKNTYSNYTFPQYCFNSVSHETEDRQGLAGEQINVEGGAGLKVVVSSQEIYSKLVEDICKHGDPGKAVISRATVVLPFDFPEDYKEIIEFPEYLSPTIRKTTDDGVTFASLSNTSSSSSEDPGTRNRNTLEYAPDITYHVQQIIRLDETDDFSNYDVWMLPMSTEYRTVESSSSTSSSDYYNYYMAYMNSLYGYGDYGYGGYGYGSYGYGGYGYDSYGYSNYYNYALYSAMYGSSDSSTTTTTTSVELDVNRYFNARLHGPLSKDGRVPVFKVMYALPRE